MNRERIMVLYSEIMQKGHKLSIPKTFYYNRRLGLQGISLKIAKGSIIEIKKTARVHIPFGKLELGFDYLNRNRTSLKMGKGSRLYLYGSACIGNGSRITVADGAILTIGKDVFINENSRITATRKIQIGTGTYLAWDVVIIDTDFHHIIEKGIKKSNTAGVFIGDNVWICAGAMILKGVTIGSGAVIGSRAVVTGDVPPNCLVGGNPAKVIRDNAMWGI
jgi:acetyltransferase-like isoleucine patch superfamily enzyme